MTRRGYMVHTYTRRSNETRVHLMCREYQSYTMDTRTRDGRDTALGTKVLVSGTLLELCDGVG